MSRASSRTTPHRYSSFQRPSNPIKMSPLRLKQHLTTREIQELNEQMTQIRRVMAITENQLNDAEAVLVEIEREFSTLNQELAQDHTLAANLRQELQIVRAKAGAMPGNQELLRRCGVLTDKLAMVDNHTTSLRARFERLRPSYEMIKDKIRMFRESMEWCGKSMAKMELYRAGRI